MIAYRTIRVVGTEVFYREASEPAAPTVLLLHGFPSPSAQYQDLMERREDRYHLIAPDYMRVNQPPALLPRGRNDQFFPPDGARAYRQDLRDAEPHVLDTGHFATATHNDEIAELVAACLNKHVARDGSRWTAAATHTGE